MIFSLFKKRKEEQPPPPSLKIDLHSHLIPGIDDGSRNMEESLRLLKGMKALGYEKMITTPHIMLDAYKNTPEIVKKGLASLRSAVEEAGLEIEIEAAAEYYLDEGFYDLLKKDEMLVIKGDYLLFETSYISKPIQLEEMIFEISAAGYKPLLAHPERYRYIKDPEKEFGRYKELGVLFQVNLNSFGGYYGQEARQQALFLSKHGMIDFLGSDVHHIKQVENLLKVFDSKAYRDIFIHNKIKNDTLY